MDQHTIGVIGLGYIGQPTVAALANVGYRVVGMDVDSDKVAQLRKGNASVYEPGLAETLTRSNHLLRFTTSYEDVMRECDAVFITVGTPLDQGNEPNMTTLDAVVVNIAKHLRPGTTIILRSTVVPGTTAKAANALEEATGMKCGTDFYVSFCPERTIEGLALFELYNLPKIIGGIDRASSEQTVRILQRMGGKVITVSSAAVAELCKLADNMYRSLNVAFANEFGNICEGAEIDAYEVVDAVNSAYNRTTIFRPALGAGGPCLSKDPLILRHFAQSKNVATPILDSSVASNIAATHRVAQEVDRFLSEQRLEHPRVAMLGLAFKGMPETDDARGAPANAIYQELLERQRREGHPEPDIRFFDPIVRNFCGRTTEQWMDKCIDGANVVLFLTDHLMLRNVPLDWVLAGTGRPLLVVDAWHNLICPAGSPIPNDVRLFRIGDGR